MIDRYTRPEMGRAWALVAKYGYWLTVEKAIVAAKHSLGMISDRSIVTDIIQYSDFTVERITELDEGPKGFHHDMIAFIETCKEMMRAKGVSEENIAHFHNNVTSYDVEDSAFSLQLRDVCTMILERLKVAREFLWRRSVEFKYTPMMGLTHGQAAEPITLGLKLLNFVDILDRDIERLTNAMEMIRVGRLAGAVGNYAHLGIELEKKVCMRLGLKPARLSTQIIHRDRHAELFSVITLIACNIGHIAHNLWAMCQFPRMEAREGFASNQRGSSQMPHKRNPHGLERLRGLASTVRGYGATIYEMVPTMDERTIDQSSAERIVWADGTTLVHYMLYQLARIVEKMEFFPERMMKNIDSTLGLICSGQVKDLLLEKGVTELDYEGQSQSTYVFVQSCAFEAWQRQVPLADILVARGVGAHLTSKELVQCFDINRSLTHIPDKFSEFQGEPF